MPIRTLGEQLAMAHPSTVPWVTLGTVVDTNDPQQMGRLRVLCPALGDRNDAKMTDIPWASYVSPFAGTLTCGARGPEQAISSGPVSYGMWAIPKIGSNVIIMCLDGNVNYRIWLGSIYGQFLTHTLPMGRWKKESGIGPLTSTENFIQPVYDNGRTAFNDEIQSPEWKTRMAEGQAAGISSQVVDRVVSKEPDERFDEKNRQGYQRNRLRPNMPHPNQDLTGGANLDSQVFSFTSPGLHSFIMDDSLGNGRIRIRSTSGNQIIMDDTNERLYVNTPDGKNYIEMDRAGNVDIYSHRRISVHAEKDINFTAGQTFRVSANDIHFRAANDFRVHSDSQINLLSGSDFTVHSKSILYITSNSDTHARSGGDFRITTNDDIHIFSGGEFNTSVLGDIDFTIGENFHVVAAGSGAAIAMDTSNGTIHFNSSLAFPSAALGATIIDEVSVGAYAYTTNRVPIHEPWGRISNDSDQTDQDAAENELTEILNMTKTSSILEISYSSDSANSTDLGDVLGRNSNWRR